MSRPKNISRIVMKFGGTSVANLERIHHVATLVKREYDQGHEVAVVVSAMAGETNRLIDLCEAANPLFDAREYDAVVSSGEQVTSGLLAITLQSMGILARSWMGWQLPFQTNRSHGNAKITDVSGDKVIERFKEKQVAVVPGFQGVSPENRITTLGRGGSDTSAVAIAIAIKADRCDIYTDVDGVYSADPRIVKPAHKIDCISFEEMLEMAGAGAKVLQTRSVSLAMRYNMPIRVLSSMADETQENSGTLVSGESKMEEKVVNSVTTTRDEARITVAGIPDKPGVAAEIFECMAKNAINVDMIVQSTATGDETKTDMTFTVAKAEMKRAVAALEGLNTGGAISQDDKVAKVSIVGVGMKSNTGVAMKMFKTLSENAINIQTISTSEIKVSVLIHEDFMELAARHLHTAFELDADEL